MGRRQIAALSELLELSNACHRSERRLRSGSSDRVAWIEQRFEDTRERFQDRYALQQRAIEADRDSRRRRQDTAEQKQRAKLDGDLKVLRERLDSTSGDSRKQTEQEMNHERWVAESMLEGRLTELGAERERDLEQATAVREAAEATAERARRDLRAMRHRHLTLDELPNPAAAAEELMDFAAGADPVAEVDQRVEAYPAERDRLTAGFQRLHGLLSPMLFLGPIPYVLWLLGTLGGAAGAVYLAQQQAWPWSPVLVGFTGLAVGGGLTWLLGWLTFRWVSGRVVRAKEDYEAARRDHHRYLTDLHAAIQAKYARRADAARSIRETAEREIRGRFEPLLDQLREQREASGQQLQARYEKKLRNLQSKHQQAREAFENEAAASLDHLKRRRTRRLDIAGRRRDRDLRNALAEGSDRLSDLQRRWDDGRDRVLNSLDEIRQLEQTTNRPWDDPAWDTWQPPTTAAPAVRFGTLHIDVDSLIDQEVSGGRFDLSLPPQLHIPALLSGPDQRSLYVAGPPEQRAVWCCGC